MPNFAKSKGFKLRSGNVANAPFKLMGSSKKTGLEVDSKYDDFGKESINKVEVGNKVMKGTAKDKGISKNIEESKGPSKETKKKIKEDKASIEKQAKEVGKPKEKAGKTKKKLFGNKEVELEFAYLAEMLEPYDRKKGLAAGMKEDMEKQATIKKSEVFAADAETRAQEMHDSKLARNESLTKRTNQLAANESAQGNNTIDPTSEFAVVPGEEGETVANMESEG